MLENHPIFPERANISLAHVTSPTAITLRVWERGAGLTQGLRQRGLRCGRVRGAPKLHRPHGDRDAAWRAARHRVARRRSHPDDRPGRAGARGRARAGGDGLIHKRAASSERSTLDTPRRAGSARRARRHAGLPAQRLRVGGDAGACGRGRARRYGDRQHLRGHGRGRAPGRPDHPQAQARQSRRPASSSPAAPRRSSRERFADMPEVDGVIGNAEKMRAETYRGLGLADSAARGRQRHHVGARDRARLHRRLRQQGARLRRGAERLRPPLHLLHHPVRPRAVALGAGGRGRGPGAQAGGGRLRRDRAHRRRHHRLRDRPAGRHDLGQAGAAHPAPGAGARAPAGFRRSIRSRPTRISWPRSPRSRGSCRTCISRCRPATTWCSSA